MTGAVHLTAIRLIEHTILMWSCFRLAVLTVVCLQLCSAVCCRDRKACQGESVNGTPPPHLMLLFIALFFITIVPGQLFHNTSSSGNCLVHDACLGPLPKSNFSSKFRECHIWVSVYILVNSMLKIMGANEKWSPVMAWEEDQKVAVASCVLNPHNTCRACCQDKTPRPVARRTDWAAGRVRVDFIQEALVFAVHWYGIEIEGGRRREWRWGIGDRVERGENAGGLGMAQGLEDETNVELKKEEEMKISYS